MLKLHFLNVENGDCTIVEYLSQSGERDFGVVDCNRTPTRHSPALEKLRALGAEKLSFVCITHPDKDHFSGIYDVLTAYRGSIDAFYTYPLGPVLADKELLKRYLRQIAAIAKRGDNQDITRRYSELMQIIKFGYEEFAENGTWFELTGDFDTLGIDGFNDVEFFGIMPPKKVKGQMVQEILGTDPADIRSLNNNSISSALLLRYGGRTITLGGDATNENWQAHRRYRERARVSISSNAVKLPHHGSRYDNKRATLEDFFQGMNPAIAVISADGRRHPDYEIFQELDRLGCRRLCTNVCNPDERALKRIYQNEELSKRLNHLLNVYTQPHQSRAVACKGDITIIVRASGEVSYETELNSVCPCTHFDDLLEAVA
ncbi:hypothetical protein HB771_17240 [Rhizobium leguminosarum bv. viciae]|nr:hypothetical protein HB771_17240 [Rhizobium leguminosarum bv. viciae]